MRPTNEQALEMIKELGKLVRAIGFDGLVVMLDEAEAIPSYVGSSRQKLCYGNLCRLLERESRMPYCYFVYATTPDFFRKSEGKIPFTEQSQEVLELAPLSNAEYMALGYIIRDLYRLGEEWKGWDSSFNNQQIDRCVEGYMKMCTQDVKPRYFVRALVSALDICAANPKKNYRTCFYHRWRFVNLDYQWKESYTQVVKAGGHMRFFERLFTAHDIHSLVIISPWIGFLQREKLGYSLEDIARSINSNQIPTYIITRDPESETVNREAIDIFYSCPSVNLYYNNSLHAKIYVCRCEPFGFALLSSANLSMASSSIVEIGLMIEGKGYGQMIIEELEHVGKEDLPGMPETKAVKYAKKLVDRI